MGDNVHGLVTFRSSIVALHEALQQRHLCNSGRDGWWMSDFANGQTNGRTDGMADEKDIRVSNWPRTGDKRASTRDGEGIG